MFEKLKIFQTNPVLVWILAFLLHYLCLLTFTYAVIHRLLAQLILSIFSRGKYKFIPTAGLTTFFADQSKGASNVVLVLECQGSPDILAIRKKLEDLPDFQTTIRPQSSPYTRPYLPFEKLRWVICEKLFLFCWRLNHKFVVDDHLYLSDGTREINMLGNYGKDLSFETIILRKCEELMAKIWDDSKPQWEVHVLIPPGYKETSGGKFALVWSISHVYSDATSMIQLLRYALADSPFSLKIEPLEWNRRPDTDSWGQKWRERFKFLFLATLAMPCHVQVSTRAFRQPELPVYDKSYSRHKCHCRLVTMELRTLKQIQKSFYDRQINSNPRLVTVLYACIAPVLHKLFQEQAKVNGMTFQPKSILASTIECNYPYKDIEIQNNFTVPWFNLPLRIQDPGERLRVIEQNIRKRTTPFHKNIIRCMTYQGAHVCTYSLRAVKSARAFGSAGFVSNVIGPSENFTIFGGIPVQNMYCFAPVSAEQQIFTLLLLSYGGKVNLSFLASDRSQKILDRLVEGVRNEIRMYENLASV